MGSVEIPIGDFPAGLIMSPSDIHNFSGILTLPGTVGRGFFRILSRRMCMAHGYLRYTQIFANRNELFRWKDSETEDRKAVFCTAWKPRRISVVDGAPKKPKE
jgi:hypothetical protein